LREALDLYREIGATGHADRLALEIQPTASQGGAAMIYEIRNYHFRPDLIDAYKAWAKAEAIPHLAS